MTIGEKKDTVSIRPHRFLLAVSLFQSNLVKNSISTGSPNVSADLINRFFVKSLLHHVKQGVGFVDLDQNILVWNSAAESITGRAAVQMIGKKWSVDQLRTLSMVTCCKDRQAIFDGCPVQACLEQNQPVESRIIFEHDDETLITAELQTIPLATENGQLLGTVLMIDDLSSEKRLENQVHQLHRQMSLDPLTQVPNRIEFDQTLEGCFDAFRNQQTVSSLAICDIDFFKRINDDFGHEKGDRALIAFAGHLQQFVRGEDLVARYGGEEFVIIFHDCDLESAVARAEKIRQALEVTAQDDLDGKCLTASFGVAQVQNSDCAKSLFVRADHALLNAKSSGRNCVVSTQEDHFAVPANSAEPAISPEWKKSRHEPLIQEQYETPTPPDVLLAKIRGFIEEQSASITKVEEDFVSLDFGGSQSLFRRGADQSIGLVIDIEMKNESGITKDGRRGQQTVVRCSVRPRRSRDRRRKDLMDAANHLLQTLRSYMMIPRQPAKPERAATRPGDGRV